MVLWGILHDWKKGMTAITLKKKLKATKKWILGFKSVPLGIAHVSIQKKTDTLVAQVVCCSMDAIFPSGKIVY